MDADTHDAAGPPGTVYAANFAGAGVLEKITRPVRADTLDYRNASPAGPEPEG